MKLIHNYNINTANTGDPITYILAGDNVVKGAKINEQEWTAPQVIVPATGDNFKIVYSDFVIDQTDNNIARWYCQLEKTFETKENGNGVVYRWKFNGDTINNIVQYNFKAYYESHIHSQPQSLSFALSLSGADSFSGHATLRVVPAEKIEDSIFKTPAFCRTDNTIFKNTIYSGTTVTFTKNTSIQWYKELAPAQTGNLRQKLYEKGGDCYLVMIIRIDPIADQTTPCILNVKKDTAYQNKFTPRGVTNDNIGAVICRLPRYTEDTLW